MGKAISLASVSATRAVLEEHGLATKHALGQNFLVNDHILDKIIALAEVDAHDKVLEVGPGIGTLTIALLQHAAYVLSIERDADLLPALSCTTAPWAERFDVVNMDALAFKGGAGCLDGPQDVGHGSGLRFSLVDDAFKLVSNLPYAVAATVVLDYFQRFEHMASATVMVQREVADRMAAHPGTKDYGAYTVKLSLFAQPTGRFSVGPGNFYPPPRVESAVIRLDRRPVAGPDGGMLTPAQLKATCRMADAAFANRRKTLSNSCKASFAHDADVDAHALDAMFERANIDPRRRGETLSLEEFVALGIAYDAFLCC